MRATVKMDISGISRALFLTSVEAQKSAKRAITAVSLKIEGDAKQKIQTGSRSGRIYKRGKKEHQASASGEPPKTDTGQLVQSITTEFDFDRLGSTVGSRATAPYGYTLEFGTSKLQPRPWLQPTLDENKGFIEKRYKKSLDEIAGIFGRGR